ncbi:hypothetical protein GCK72_008454 [Caenorhabditis remanei]|uniref:Uncharacterized protein n=1 Tax=Caenorhabditis remanei TaxID=31234 RepID=A0A6A5GXM7_CAERE|nr:hypothetical protein GCK72_008454 [Caenorhabditis remanei]KAF1760208.1 hypothetical protein GCK72_008454 [Caenorhabditis remanei]
MVEELGFYKKLTPAPIWKPPIIESPSTYFSGSPECLSVCPDVQKSRLLQSVYLTTPPIGAESEASLLADIPRFRLQNRLRRYAEKWAWLPNGYFQPHGRLGPVQSATPTPTPKMKIRRTIGPHCLDVEDLRRKRAIRQAMNPEVEPSLIVGGISPFDQKNVGESIKEFRKLVTEKFCKHIFATPGPSTNRRTMKLVFRPEIELDQDETEMEVKMEGGGGDGMHHNSTIVID